MLKPTRLDCGELIFGILMPIPIATFVSRLALPVRLCLVVLPAGSAFVLLTLLRPEVDEKELLVE